VARRQGDSRAQEKTLTSAAQTVLPVPLRAPIYCLSAKELQDDACSQGCASTLLKNLRQPRIQHLVLSRDSVSSLSTRVLRFKCFAQ